MPGPTPVSGSRRRLHGDRGELRLPVLLGAGLAILVVAVLSIRIAAFTGLIDASDKPRVLVIGDSISDRGQPALHVELDGSYRISVDGKASYTASMQEPSASRWATRDFHQVVVNLGTNDLVRGDPVADTADALERIVALYPDALCVHVVNMNEDMPPSTGPNIQRAAVQLNQRIQEMADANPKIRVVDWAEIVSEQFDDDVDPTLDGVHPTEDGHELLAAAVADSLAECEPAGTA